MGSKVTKIQVTSEEQDKVSGFIIGILECVDPKGRLFVSWMGLRGYQQKSWVRTVRSMDKPLTSADVGKKVILGFENGDPRHPIIFGLLVEHIAVEPVRHTPELEATSDIPESIHLKSEKELILECGKAKISLREDGRIVILGGYVVSRSTGVNKIKGGSVQIN